MDEYFATNDVGKVATYSKRKENIQKRAHPRTKPKDSTFLHTGDSESVSLNVHDSLNLVQQRMIQKMMILRARSLKGAIKRGKILGGRSSLPARLRRRRVSGIGHESESTKPFISGTCHCSSSFGLKEMHSRISGLALDRSRD